MRRFNPINLFYLSPAFAFVLCLAIYVLLIDFVGQPSHHIFAFLLLGVFTAAQFLIAYYLVKSAREDQQERNKGDDEEPPTKGKYRDVVVLGEEA